MTNFESFGLSAALNASLARMHYTAPTPIQAQAIPLALSGRDILGSAQTGTGKTGAFSIPLVEMVLQNPRGCALVLTPTRELAKQVMDVIHQLLGKESKIKTAFIIGGDAYAKQVAQIKARPRIIVGTPGRINDHLGTFPQLLADTQFLVLDETDRMLDMGFGVQLDAIAKFLPEKRQTLMFSATLPKGIEALSAKYLVNPERVSAGEVNVIAKNIKQEVMRIEQPQKYPELVSQLHEREGSVIIFVKTKHGADRIATNLSRDGFEAEALHGDLKQRQRDRVMREYRNQKFRILVATDIAARGLDVPHIEHVINFDLPQVAEDYIHRMGRTARAGATGSALCFIASQDGRKWHAIERLINPDAANDRGKSGRGAERSGKGRSKRFGERPARPERFERSERPSGGERFERNDRPVSGERFERNDRPARSQDGDKRFGSPKAKFFGKDKPNDFTNNKTGSKMGGKAGKPYLHPADRPAPKNHDGDVYYGVEPERTSKPVANKGKPKDAANGGFKKERWSAAKKKKAKIKTARKAA